MVVMDILTIFSERLKELMEEKGFNTLTLEKAAKISNGAISNWLNKKYLPNSKKLISLSICLNCSTDFLIGKVEVPDVADVEFVSSFTERLLSLAKESGKTLHGIAVDLNIDDATLYNWGSGKYVPGIPNLLILADYFGCTTDYLLGRRD